MMFNTIILLEEPAHLLLVLPEFSPKQFPGRDEELGPSRAISGLHAANCAMRAKTFCKQRLRLSSENWHSHPEVFLFTFSFLVQIYVQLLTGMHTALRMRRWLHTVVYFHKT